MNKMKKIKNKNWITIIVSLTVLINEVLGQEKSGNSIDEKAAQVLFENQKFNVVIGIISIIFIGIVFYIIRLDSKISKLEKK